MQHLDNDMDELFNKAGKEYPLDTSGADWESVRKSLTSELSGGASARKAHNYKRYTWLLLLLIPALWLAYPYTKNSQKDSSASPKTAGPGGSNAVASADPKSNSLSEGTNDNNIETRDAGI